MSFKKKVYEHCQAVIAAKLALYQNTLRELALSAANETKSSAGDKYETGRAMLHIEQDNVRRQFADALSQKAVLDAIDLTIHHTTAVLGSLLETCSGYYFLSTALGRINVDGKTVIALSPASPLGSRLIKLQTGDRIEINGVATEIVSVQ